MQELDHDLHAAPLKSTCVCTVDFAVILCLISYLCVSYNKTNIFPHMLLSEEMLCLWFDTYTVIQYIVLLMVWSLKWVWLESVVGGKLHGVMMKSTQTLNDSLTL